MKKAALISVSDKSELIPFAKALSDMGFVLLATSGSRSSLTEAGIPTESIETYTGQREILGGRVKTLHPKIHAGLLAKRDDPEHMAQLEAEGIYPIDVAVINLYPFLKHVQGELKKDPARMIELIDVGGPTMIRASAKNFSGVLPVLDPADYSEVIAELHHAKGEVRRCSMEFRRRLSAKVFAFTAHYDLTIASYLSGVSYTGENQGATVFDTVELSPLGGLVWERAQSLRYGENPHQKAQFCRIVGGGEEPRFTQLQGKELSFNNLLDYDAAVRMVQSFPRGTIGAVIIKHVNPCGAAFGGSVVEAIRKAKQCDPRSHFGGIIATNAPLDGAAAQEITGDFAEIVVAPSVTDEARAILCKSKNLRVLEADLSALSQLEVRSIQGGVLVQERDIRSSSVEDAKVVSSRAPTDFELQELSFAWTMCNHVKSNAIVLAKQQLLIGVGAGQMSRIDSAEVAVMKAKTHQHSLSGAVAASDAFFPFPDTIEFLATQGVSAIIAPGGAKRDPEVIEAANAKGVALLFVEDRHFRH